MQGMTRFAVHHPLQTLLGLAVVLAVFGAGLPKLEKDARVEALVSQDEYHVRLKHEMADVFGNPDFILIGVDEPELFSAETFARAEAVAEDLAADQRVQEVHSVFNKEYLRGEEGFFQVGDLVDAPPEALDFDQLKQRLRDTPMYRGNIVGLDYQRLALLVEFRPGLSDAVMTGHVQDVLARHERLEQWNISGLPVIQDAMTRGMDRDMGVLMPLFLVFLAVMFFIAFRSLRGVLLPFVPVIFSVVVALGTMGWAGLHLTVVSNIIPMLLIAITSAYTIHFLNQYYMELVGPRDRHDTVVARGTHHIGGIIILAALTTVIGFSSNLFNPVTAIRDFGLMVSVGIAAAALACLTALPAILTLLGEPRSRRTAGRTDTVNQFLDAVLSGLGPRVRQHRRLLVITAGAVMAASLAGVGQVKVESSGLSFFKDDTSLVRESRALSRNFGGVVGFNFRIDTGRTDGVKDPEVLATIDRFTRWLKEQYPEEIKVTLSLADYIKQMSKAYNGGEQYYAVPDTQDEILQYFEVYAWSGNIQQDFRTLTSDDWSQTRVSGRFALKELPGGGYREFSVQHQREIIAAGERWLEKNLPDSASAEPFGEIMIASVINDSIIKGQVISLTLAWAMVFLVCLVVLRSFVGGLIALIPVTFAIAVNFGVMGFAGIPLNIGTALVSAMAIGIGIDDTIHYLMTMRRFRSRGHDWLKSTELSMQHAGRAILYTTMALVVAYAVMLLSDFMPIAYFGLLNIVTILGATYGALVVMAALILMIRPRFLTPRATESGAGFEDALGNKEYSS